MHELWHFYTWYKFGESERINPKKYNDFKEALAVLLNIECPDLMGEAVDGGYPQHAYLRTEIIEEWKKSKDINKVWRMLQTRPDLDPSIWYTKIAQRTPQRPHCAGFTTESVNSLMLSQVTEVVSSTHASV